MDDPRTVSWSSMPPKSTPLPRGMVPEQVPDPPVTPRNAATVVLLRGSADGPEAFLLRRVTQMAFAGGMTVFPGGGVDARDADAALAWAGDDPSWWAERFGCDRPLARALVCAAVRETFEESGVLLAGPSPDTIVADAGSYGAARRALVARELSLAEFLAAEQLVLRADLLRPWANWITPEAEPRRYDTRFFVAALPDGQRADGDTSEAERAGWRRPADAVADAAAGRHPLMVPTWSTLAELAAFASVDDILRTRRTIEQILPEVVREAGAARVVLPDTAPHRGEEQP